LRGLTFASAGFNVRLRGEDLSFGEFNVLIQLRRRSMAMTWRLTVSPMSSLKSVKKP